VVLTKINAYSRRGTAIRGEHPADSRFIESTVDAAMKEHVEGSLV
jgi:hypothetical protein